MDISKRDFETGLTYVRIFRVKEVGGIMFDRFFDISRFTKKSNDIRLLCIKDQRKKNGQIPFRDLK